MFSEFSQPRKPAVVGWYAAYCIALACIYLLFVFFGLIMLLAGHETEMNPGEATFLGLMFIGTGLVLAVPFAAGPFLPRERWAWIVGIVLIGIGMTSACCLPAAIPLLISWLKPETKAYYNAGD